jgi:hypothetical protein
MVQREVHIPQEVDESIHSIPSVPNKVKGERTYPNSWGA